MARAGLKRPPAAWVDALAGVLSATESESFASAVGVVRTWPAAAIDDSLATALLRLSSNDRVPPETRFQALAATTDADLEPARFTELLASVERTQAFAVRSAAAQALAAARLSEPQLIDLAARLDSVAPLELDKLLEAFAKSREDRAGLALVRSLARPELRPLLRPETLKPRLKDFGPAVAREAERLYDLLAADRAEQTARLERFLATAPPGDVRRGQAVFNDAKHACIGCHAMGYLGGKIGPDLTRIGGVRAERDLAEAVLFPSASLVRSYEPVAVTTHSGRAYNGLVKAETAELVILTISATEEVRLERSDIDQMEPSPVSIMPAGLDKQLTPQQLADLLAFLRASK
jgi:putative heme-binding domain-containing protein